MALDRLQATPEESIYVGDFDVDIEASRSAGTMSVLALWSSTGSEKLIGLKPDLYFRSPYTFLSWLEENVEVQSDGEQNVLDG
jgi:phosphoglycolate phosphatase/pyrophosphatase PpaX